MKKNKSFLLTCLKDKPGKNIINHIVKYVGSDKKRFAELFKIFEETGGGVSNRAAWAMSYLVIETPSLIHPYFSKIIAMLCSPGHHAAIYRNILRFLKQIEIPEKYQGDVYDACLSFFMNAGNPIAVRSFSLYVLLRMSKLHPELKQELKIILHEQKEFNDSPAVKNVINKTIAAINKD